MNILYNQEGKALWKLALPVILTTAASMMLGVVDLIMVGRLGPEAIAGLSVAVTWLYGSGVFIRHLAGGVEPLVSQASGREQDAIRGKLFQHVLWASVFFFLPQVCLYFVAEKALLFFGQQPEIATIAGGYCAVLAFSVPADLLFFYSMRFFQAMEKVKQATMAVVIANVVNVLCNYLLIYKMEWGVIGSAWASCVASYSMLFVMLIGLRREIADFCRERYPLSLDIFQNMWKLAWPASLQLTMETWGFMLSVLFAGWIGTDEQAVHSIVLNIASMCFMLPLGLSVATSTRVGMMIGTNGDWQNSMKQGVYSLLLVDAMLITILVVAAPYWMAIYTEQPDLIEMGIPLLYICAAFQLFDGGQVFGLAVLRGMGDVRFPLVFNIVAYWVIGVPLALYMAFRLHWGVAGLWWGLAIALAIVAMLCVLRIRYWMHKGIISLYHREETESDISVT